LEEQEDAEADQKSEEEGVAIKETERKLDMPLVNGQYSLF
jgi:hypothetical protein